MRKIGFWLNTLFSVETHSHFRCKCGRLLLPNTKGQSERQLFSCPLSSGSSDHDKDVYIYWCAGTGCSSVIDSRILTTCSEGWYVCRSCNLCGCNSHSVMANNNENIPACYACRRKLNWNHNIGLSNNQVVNDTADKMITCICGKLNRISSQDKREGIEKDNNICLWPKNYPLFKYNTRPLDSK